MKKMPSDGELVCIMSTDNVIHPHTVALYLDEGKIVIPSYIKGWVIADLKDLESYSPFGSYNIQKTYHNAEGKVIGYDYIAETKSKIILNLRKNEGTWSIENDFKHPHWSAGVEKIDHDANSVVLPY